jgi:hypothetical protein
MPLIRPAALLLPLILLTGCTSYKVNHDYDVTADFSRYKTFDYFTAKKNGTGGTTTFMDNRVRAALESELMTRGFTKETKGDPDFLVTYYPVMQQKQYHTTTHVGFGWGSYPGFGHVGTSSTQAHQYKEGTIVIEIVDFRSNRMVWQGAAVGALSDQYSPEEASEIIPRAVHDILAKFPPGKSEQ